MKDRTLKDSSQNNSTTTLKASSGSRLKKTPLLGAAAAMMLVLSACGGGASGLPEHQDALDSVSDFESALADVEDADDFDALEDEVQQLAEDLECLQEVLEYDAEASGEAVLQAAGADEVVSAPAPEPDC